jgi:hypothetical protein
MRRLIQIVVLGLVAISVTARPLNVRQDTAPQSDAKAQALKLYLVIQKQDWESLYSLILFSPRMRQGMSGDSGDFAAGIRQGISENDGQKALRTLFENMSDIAVGEPVVNGDKAEVPTSSKDIISGKTVFFKGTAHMIKDGTVWKWDLSFTDDIGAATSQQLIDLIGKPSSSP